MTDFLYKPEDVDSELRPIFEQLCKEFGTTCQVWRRVEDFGRRISAGVVDNSTMAAAIILLRTSTRTLKTELIQREVDQIQKHFASGTGGNLTL